MFQTQFFDGPHSIKHSLMFCQAPNYIFYIVNAKATTKQIHPKWIAGSAVHDTK
jgi:hypothetical protein